MGGRTQEYIIPHPTDNQSLHWPRDDSSECPPSPPVFAADCLHAFLALFMLLFKGMPSNPKGLFCDWLIIHQRWGKEIRYEFVCYEFMKSKPEPLTAVLPVRGRIMISGECCCCSMTEGQSVHRGVSSKFHSGISGQPVPLDDIFFSHSTRSM